MRRATRLDISPYPLTFDASYQPRVWGGRRIAAEFGRKVPEGPIGESWELVDRPGVVSTVDQGPLEGTTLGELWTSRPEWFPAPGTARPSRFPLLIKLLDCHEHLSVQVHPSARVASRVGGEPKAELWYFLDTAGEASIYAGFRQGITRAHLEHALVSKPRSVVSLLHTMHPRSGDALLIPPGRIHALGPGSLLCEIQQNSDTTFRVYDWDRHNLGTPRPLHIREALAALDFRDWEPDFMPRDRETLVQGPWFRVVRRDVLEAQTIGAANRFVVGLVTRGQVALGAVQVGAGRCFLLPSGCWADIRPRGGPAQFLEVSLP